MDFLDYREKLGIGFCDNEKYKFFLVKIFNILGEIALDTRFCGINANEYREFCRITVRKWITNFYLSLLGLLGIDIG